MFLLYSAFQRIMYVCPLFDPHLTQTFLSSSSLLLSLYLFTSLSFCFSVALICSVSLSSSSHLYTVFYPFLHSVLSLLPPSPSYLVLSSNSSSLLESHLLASHLLSSSPLLRNGRCPWRCELHACRLCDRRGEGKSIFWANVRGVLCLSVRVCLHSMYGVLFHVIV